MRKTGNHESFVTIGEVAADLGIPSAFVRRLIKAGKLKAYALNAGVKNERPRYLVATKDVEEFLERSATDLMDESLVSPGPATRRRGARHRSAAPSAQQALRDLEASA